MKTVDAARRRSIMSPLLITTLGSALCAAVVVFPLLGAALIVAPLSLLTIALVLWAVLASGHFASFDRRLCKGPLTGPIAATGKACPEGWKLYVDLWNRDAPPPSL